MGSRSIAQQWILSDLVTKYIDPITTYLEENYYSLLSREASGVAKYYDEKRFKEHNSYPCARLNDAPISEIRSTLARRIRDIDSNTILQVRLHKLLNSKELSRISGTMNYSKRIPIRDAADQLHKLELSPLAISFIRSKGDVIE